MNKNIINLIFFISILTLFFCSCGNNKSSLDKQFKKAQKIYDKKGMDGFCKYLKKNSYIAVRDSLQNGATPLLLAVKNGEIEKVNLFFEKGASVEEKDINNRDLIDYALENTDTTLLDFVISKMPASYWNELDSNGNLEFIRIIAQYSDFNIIKKVIDLSNDIDHANNNAKTPLMYASQCNTDVRAVKYLLDKGARIDAKNDNEWSALMYAARYNPNPCVMEDLILRGANTTPNSVGLTITMLASCNPNPGVLFTLLKYKNEVNSATDKGKTALMYACENEQDSSVIKMLIDNNVALNVKDEDGKTALMYALEYYSKPEAIYVMLAAGANTDDKDNSGKTVRDYLSSNKKLLSSDIEKAISVIKSITEKQKQQYSNIQTETEDNLESNNVSTDNEGVSGSNIETDNENETSTDKEGAKE